MLGFEDRNITDGPRGTKASFLLCGMQGLDLFEASENVYGRRVNHMALNAASEDMDQFVMLLSQTGIAALVRTPRNSVFIPDPDRHRLEILP